MTTIFLVFYLGNPVTAYDSHERAEQAIQNLICRTGSDANEYTIEEILYFF